ncbi:hypothetical protein FOCC_FOCC008374 [Frankliniella occidentalis]|nr:hypothetical protein FOCC_FOCC008374 [Frankliniella occidentalis]
MSPGVSTRRTGQSAAEINAANDAAQHEAVLRPIREDWRAFLRCSDNNRCDYRTGLCPQPDDKCVEMARHQCRCGCLGYPGVTMNSEVWDECWEACEHKIDRACEGTTLCHWDDWDCMHLCPARCRCECAQKDRNRTTSAPAATGSGDSGTSPPEALRLSAGSSRAALSTTVTLAALTTVTRLFSTRGRSL